MERSDFDVSRPISPIQEEDEEPSIDDRTVTSKTEDKQQTTYSFINTGSVRGNTKLVSSDGYTYVFKSQLKSGATVWRCSVRNKKIFCKSTVHQIGEEFSRSGTNHQHPAEPGVSINVQVKAELKTKAAENIFAPASSIIADVVDRHVTADQPPAARAAARALHILHTLRN